METTSYIILHYYRAYTRLILGLYWNDGTENGNYHSIIVYILDIESNLSLDTHKQSWQNTRKLSPSANTNGCSPYLGHCMFQGFRI